MEAATPALDWETAGRGIRPWIGFAPLVAGPLVFLIPVVFILPSGGSLLDQRVLAATWGVLWLVGLAILYLDFRAARWVLEDSRGRLPRSAGYRLAIVSTIVLGVAYFVVAVIAFVPRCLPSSGCTPIESFVDSVAGVLGAGATIDLAFLVLPLLGIVFMAVAIGARLDRAARGPRSAPTIVEPGLLSRSR